MRTFKYLQGVSIYLQWVHRAIKVRNNICVDLPAMVFDPRARVLSSGRHGDPCSVTMSDFGYNDRPRRDVDVEFSSHQKPHSSIEKYLRRNLHQNPMGECMRLLQRSAIILQDAMRSVGIQSLSSNDRHRTLLKYNGRTKPTRLQLLAHHWES